MGSSVAALVVGMLVAGCLNTLLLKYQDQTCDKLVDGPPYGCASFPELQSLMMFVGESLCFLVLGINKLSLYLRSRGRTKLLVGPDRSSTYMPIGSEEIEDDVSGMLQTTLRKHSNTEIVGVKHMYLALPALCDICATTTMGVGLLLVPASVFQMCRGSLVLFVGLFSVIFLGRRLALHQWASLLLVVLGVFLVGLSNVLYTSQSDPSIHPKSLIALKAKDDMLGICLIIGAQLFAASQYILEEWILSRYSIAPLKVAAFEGLFGTILSTVGIVAAYGVYGATSKGLDGTFDFRTGLNTVLGHVEIWPAFVLFTVSIASFNFCGLSVTQQVSATSRSTIDTCRTVLIWSISLLLGWEQFKFLQLLGFVLLIYATLLFNGVVKPPRFLLTSDPNIARLEVETGLEHTLE